MILEKNYDNLSDDLFISFPEFTSIFEAYEGNYLIFSDFYDYLINNLHNRQMMIKIGNFISSYLNIQDKEITNLIVIELFHPIYGEEYKEKIILKFLNEDAKKIFLKYKNLFFN